MEMSTSVVDAKESGLTVYPNPSQDQICFDWQGGDVISEIEVFDFSGRSLKKYIAPSVCLDISDLNQGSYWARIVTSQGDLLAVSWIKMD